MYVVIVFVCICTLCVLYLYVFADYVCWEEVLHFPPLAVHTIFTNWHSSRKILPFTKEDEVHYRWEQNPLLQESNVKCFGIKRTDRPNLFLMITGDFLVVLSTQDQKLGRGFKKPIHGFRSVRVRGTRPRVVTPLPLLHCFALVKNNWALLGCTGL